MSERVWDRQGGRGREAEKRKTVSTATTHRPNLRGAKVSSRDGSQRYRLGRRHSSRRHTQRYRLETAVDIVAPGHRVGRQRCEERRRDTLESLSLSLSVSVSLCLSHSLSLPLTPSLSLSLSSSLPLTLTFTRSRSLSYSPLRFSLTPSRCL